MHSLKILKMSFKEKAEEEDDEDVDGVPLDEGKGPDPVALAMRHPTIPGERETMSRLPRSERQFLGGLLEAEQREHVTLSLKMQLINF